MTRIVSAVLAVALFACADPSANIHGKIRLTTPVCGAAVGDVVGFDLRIAPAATLAARSTSMKDSTGVEVSIACLGDAANETPFDIDLDQPGSYSVTITPWIWTLQDPSEPPVPEACAPIQLAPRNIEGSVDLDTLDVAAVAAR